MFFRLSKILKKRTPDQCRSHHQKLQMKYKDDVYAIMGEVQRKINKTIAEEYVSSQIRMQFSNAMLKKELRVTGRTGLMSRRGGLVASMVGIIWWRRRELLKFQ